MVHHVIIFLEVFELPMARISLHQVIHMDINILVCFSHYRGNYRSWSWHFRWHVPRALWGRHKIINSPIFCSPLLFSVYYSLFFKSRITFILGYISITKEMQSCSLLILVLFVLICTGLSWCCSQFTVHTGWVLVADVLATFINRYQIWFWGRGWRK